MSGRREKVAIPGTGLSPRGGEFGRSGVNEPHIHWYDKAKTQGHLKLGGDMIKFYAGRGTPRSTPAKRQATIAEIQAAAKELDRRGLLHDGLKADVAEVIGLLQD